MSRANGRTAHPHRMAAVMQIASRPLQYDHTSAGKGVAAQSSSLATASAAGVARNGEAPVQEAIDLLLKIVPAKEGHREKRHPMIIEVGDAFWLSHGAPQSFP
jgi:hypothetical protein